MFSLSEKFEAVHTAISDRVDFEWHRCSFAKGWSKQIMNKQEMLTEELITYRDCILAPILYTATQDGAKVQGYGFITIYMGLIVTAYNSRPDQWLSSVEGAIAVA